MDNIRTDNNLGEMCSTKNLWTHSVVMAHYILSVQIKRERFSKDENQIN
jgi:hypothetical protein